MNFGHPMLKVFQLFKIRFNLVRVLLLVFLLMAVFTYSSSHFLFVKAYSNQINIFPGIYELEKNDGAPGWQAIGNAFYQDLSGTAGKDEFNRDNSAHILIPDICPSVQTPSEASTTSPVVETSEEAEKPPVDMPKAEEEIIENPVTDEDIPEQFENPIESEPTELVPTGTIPEGQPAEDISPTPAEAPADEQSLGEKFFNIFAFSTANAQADNEIAGASDQSPGQSLIFSDFKVPGQLEDNNLGQIKLRLSLSAQSQNLADILHIDYKIDEEWLFLQDIDLNNPIDNAQVGDYLQFLLPAVVSWNNIDNLMVRISYNNDDGNFNFDQSCLNAESADQSGSQTQILLDAIWLEVNYKGELDEETTIQETSSEAADFSLELLSSAVDFRMAEAPKFNFKIKKKRNIINEIGAKLLRLFYDEYGQTKIKARAINSRQGNEESVLTGKIKTEYLGDGEFKAWIANPPRDLPPGTYSLELTLQDEEINNGQPLVFTQDFSWGVLAFNVNKSVFYPGEEAYLQYGVLDQQGHTLCNAKVFTEITAPDNGVAYLNTENGLIKIAPNCQPDQVTNIPDYSSYYGVGWPGTYQIKIIVHTPTGVKEFYDKFEVMENIAFDIERIGPTRIYPWANYGMNVRLRANQDYNGDIIEYLPLSYAVVDSQTSIRQKTEKRLHQTGWDLLTEENSDVKILRWQNVHIKQGDYIEINYTFDAPDVSPAFYVLGPLNLGDYKEHRQWQIAGDAEIGIVVAQNIPVTSGTSDTTNWTNILTATSTNFTGGGKYFVYVTAGFSGSAIAASTDFQVIYGSDVQYTGFVEAPGDAYDARQIAWFDVYDQPSTPTDISIQFRANSGNSYALNTQIIALNLNNLETTDWEYAASTTPVAHNTTLTTRAGVNLGSKADGVKDWLVFAMEEVQVDNAGLNYRGQIYDGTAASMYYTSEGENTNELLPYVLYRPYDNVATSSYFVIRTSDDAVGTYNDHLKSRVFALNLDAFESHKTYYADINTSLATTPTWTEIGNLNSSSNYQPTTTGDQMIFASWINAAASAAAGTNDRLQVNNSTVPSGWSWVQSPVVSRTTYDASDEPIANIVAKTSIATSGVPIDLDASEISSNTQVGDEVAMAVFSTTLKAKPATAPTGAFNSAAQKTDGSGAVDISIEVNDENGDNCKAKLEYEAGSSCSFLYNTKMTLNTTDGNTTADLGDPKVDNGSDYRLGTTTGWILTTTGSNTVNFDWSSQSDVPTADGTYCLRLTVNDGTADQTEATTTLITVDNTAPTSPGLMTATSTGTTVILTFGDPSTETNFDRYQIFYKEGSGGVTESDTELIDTNLASQDYNEATSTSVSGLNAKTQYVFNIWAYDAYGNKASSTEVTVMTGEAEPLRANTVRFLAGTYSGNGTTGQNSNTDQTFSTFNFQLAETGAVIKNAFIIFEAQYEAYANNAGNYTGYVLTFDACAESCTADAWGGSNRVYKDDNNVLSYDESESNQVRLLLDVTEEAQLAAYSGNGAQVEAQVGYRIERSSAVNSIANAKAELVVTYVYNWLNAENLTNTIVYPLESDASGDSGSRRNVQADDCTEDNCPTFSYNFIAPEYDASSQQLSQWFQVYSEVERAGGGGGYGNINANVNIETSNINSNTFVYDVANGGVQSHLPKMLFSGGTALGFVENTDQDLEISLSCDGNTASYYAMGGEVVSTFISSSSAATKTRTVYIPLGVINYGVNTNKFGTSTDIYFPENGAGSGVVDIKKAWVRIISNQADSAATNMTVSTQVGDNTESSGYTYASNPDTTVVKSSFNVIHVIPSGDYSELELANAESPKTVTVYTDNSSAVQGGTAAELVITYTYTDQSNGYLSSVNLFGGQTDTNGNSQDATTTMSNSVFPEGNGTKTLVSAGLLASYLFSQGLGAMPTANLLMDANIATGTPVYGNNFYSPVTGRNTFSEYYRRLSVFSTANNLSYIARYTNNGASDADTGAKMNGILVYTYKWDAPPPEYTQNDWRWYANEESIDPTSALASQNASTSGVNIQDILRLRINIGVSEEALATSTRSFKLQYGTGSDCTAVSDWADVGAISGTEAWQGYNNTSLEDGTSTGSVLLSSSDIFESYEEANNSTNNPRALDETEYGEWDWVLYNYGASATTNYCFRMVKSNDGLLDNYNVDSYPQLITAPANTAPANPSSLGQYRADGLTAIANLAWINEQTVQFRAGTTDPNVNEVVGLYFELIENSSSFTTATTVPVGACLSWQDYGDCSAKIWVATSTIGDYRYNAFVSTTTILDISESADGYKWQVLACDDSNECSSWSNFNSGPNFRVDITAPTPPGALTFASTTPTSLTVNYGASTTEANFKEYRIFYKAAPSGVMESDLEHDDADLDFQNYNSTTETTIINLSAGTQYVINIWAYDYAGNKASATPELVYTTGSSFTPPLGSIISLAQKTDGSGAIDIAVQADDPDNDDTLRARVDYELGTACTFNTPLDPYIDPTDDNITATYGDPDVDNGQTYQVGTTTGWIMTSPGQNYVFFDWLSKTNIPAANDTYCVRVIINDGMYDQTTTSTKLIIIDNVAPTVPGNLTLNSKNRNSITLNFGGISTDPRFSRYRIFYSTSSPPTELDYELNDANLLANNYNNAATTTISGLDADTQYYFNIWAYDDRGNNASATPISVKTNSFPNNLNILDQYRNDEVTVITNGGWTNERTIKFVAQTNDTDTNEMLSIYVQFVTNIDSFLNATTAPTNVCLSGTTFDDCPSKVWVATSTTGDYSANAFVATTSITVIPDSNSGYKWQVLACDDDGDCSTEWVKYNTVTPNVKVDATDPTPPGELSEYSKTSSSITLSYGSASVETNFLEYRIYYATSSPVTESSYLYGTSSDSDLGYKNYNNTATTTISGLIANTTYYFSIWSFDQAGNKASSTTATINTNPIVSTPGVVFYTKNTRVLFYRVWTGTAWGAEQSCPTNFGSGATDYIRHISALRSDDGSKVGLIVKTFDGTNQEWWGAVYRTAANDFINISQLGSRNSTSNAQLITSCIGYLSGGEFIIVRNNGGSAGTVVHNWNSTDGWDTTGESGPNPGDILSGCRLVRRPGTDNYLLTTYTDLVSGFSAGSVGSAYYYGGSAYNNNWTTWTEHAEIEEDLDNFVGEAFFDPLDNTRGAINFSDSNTALNTSLIKFAVTNNTINYGTPVTSPSTWANDWVHGEFAADPAGAGIAMFAGRDINDELNIFQVDISASTPTWTASTNGDNISGAALYSETNDAQKPFTIAYYKENKALVLWNNAASADPNYRLIDATTNTVDAANSTIADAENNVWVRVRTFKDPNENELIAVYQNDDVDYAAIFWDGTNEQFYNTSSAQGWTQLASALTPYDRDDECTSFAFTTGNLVPNAPSNLNQFKNNGLTAIANNGWTDENTVKLRVAATDPDTSEILRIYVQAIANADTFTTTNSVPSSPCATTTAFNDCASKIWIIATSTAGDYSATAFTATATISSLPESSAGYKWQALVCDDSNICSSWSKFNTTVPNFKVDTTAPTAPGALSILAKTSTTVTLGFGASTTESNFSMYKIYYKAGASGVTESSTEHDDSDLDYKNYNSTTNTVVINLASSTQYVFNIWAYDYAGNKASATPEIATTTNAGPNIRQMSYLLENDDGATVNDNTAEVPVDTVLSNLNRSERLNGRIQIENNGGDTATGKIYKLQFENQTDAPGTWTDVGAATAISYTAGLSGLSGDMITAAKGALNANTWTNGYWYESTNLTGSFNLINGRYTEFVFAVKTDYATLGKTYRLRLYNSTDNVELNYYGSYPTFSIVSSETKRYAKGVYASLPTTYTNLTYPLDPEGYSDVALNDNNRDQLLSATNYPLYLFATKNATNTDAMTMTWDGQSSVSAASNPVYLQVYRFGTANAWVTVATNTTAVADNDFAISATLNSYLTEYYDANNLTYWRIYQSTGTQILRTDSFSAVFSSSTPETRQIHYRWRYDNGNETGATWREGEDEGDPTGATANLDKGANIRLRFAIANLGGGTATNSIFRLEYASTTGNCTSDPGNWNTVSTDGTGHWETATSPYYNNGDTTTSQFNNSEAYAFTAGRIVEDPSATTTALNIAERYYSEIEYAIKATDAAITAGTYCFRVTNNGTALNYYDLFAPITLAGNVNTAPSFVSGYPIDDSASTSPTNYGSAVTFVAQANDSEGDDYYLAVCQTNSITAGSDGPPTCNGGSWCISNLASSTAEATCDYIAATSSESLSWYAFVCDKYPGFAVAKCSSGSQGGGNVVTNSPFAVNHAPVFTSVSTTDNNKDPGGYFTISTVSSDNDSNGSNDTLNLYVCRTNSATDAGCTGGAADTVCYATATSSPNAKCYYQDTAPTPAGNNTYYAFVFDNHGLGATANSRTSTYTINNVSPSLGLLVLNGGANIRVNLKDAGDKAVSTINTSVTDYNGCTNLVSATAIIYMSNATNGYNCSANNNDCYQITTTNCIQTECDSVDDPTATYTCTANLKYYAAPTDNSTNNPNVSHNWLSRLQVFDGLNYGATSSTGVELLTNTALDVTEVLIDFGSDMFAGENSGANNATTTVYNAGNSPIDTNLSGTDMAGVPSGILDVGNIKWSFNQYFNYNFTGQTLTIAGQNADTETPKATTTTEVYDKVYWGVGIPFAADASTYTGQNVFEVIIDSDNW